MLIDELLEVLLFFCCCYCYCFYCNNSEIGNLIHIPSVPWAFIAIGWGCWHFQFLLLKDTQLFQNVTSKSSQWQTRMLFLNSPSIALFFNPFVNLDKNWDLIAFKTWIFLLSSKAEHNVLFSLALLKWFLLLWLAFYCVLMSRF